VTLLAPGRGYVSRRMLDPLVSAALGGTEPPALSADDRVLISELRGLRVAPVAESFARLADRAPAL